MKKQDSPFARAKNRSPFINDMLQQIKLGGIKGTKKDLNSFKDKQKAQHQMDLQSRQTAKLIETENHSIAQAIAAMTESSSEKQTAKDHMVEMVGLKPKILNAESLIKLSDLDVAVAFKHHGASLNMLHSPPKSMSSKK